MTLRKYLFPLIRNLWGLKFVKLVICYTLFGLFPIPKPRLTDNLDKGIRN